MKEKGTKEGLGRGENRGHKAPERKCLYKTHIMHKKIHLSKNSLEEKVRSFIDLLGPLD